MNFDGYTAFLCITSENTNCGEMFFSATKHADWCPTCGNRDVQHLYDMVEATIHVEGESR